MPTKIFKIPKTTGACVDKLYRLELEAKELLEKVKKINEEYNFLEEHLIANLPKEKLDGAIGLLATAKLEPHDLPNARDWDKVHTYIIKNDAWDLLQKRLSITACRERWEAKKVIPGIEIFTKIKLKLTKRKKK